MSLYLSNFKELATELSLDNLARDNFITILIEFLFLSNFEEIATELSLTKLAMDNSVTILVQF